MLSCKMWLLLLMKHSTRHAGCLNATWFSGNIRSVVQIFGSLLYYISLILSELLSNYILIKLSQEISCPEIAKQNVVALASIRNLQNSISGCLTTTWFSFKNCSVENKTRKRFTLLCPYDTRVLSNYILVELW